MARKNNYAATMEVPTATEGSNAPEEKDMAWLNRLMDPKQIGRKLRFYG